MHTNSRNDHWSIHKRNAVRRIDQRPVLLITRRHVKPECSDVFEKALRAIVTFAIYFPGHLDVYVLRRVRGRNFDCAISSRFADSLARGAFTGSREYHLWLRQLQLLTDEAREEEDSMNPECNGARSNDASPPVSRIQAFVGLVAFLCLFPAALGLPWAVYFFLSDWHPVARSVL